jgi:hypothetical protein
MVSLHAKNRSKNSQLRSTNIRHAITAFFIIILVYVAYWRQIVHEAKAHSEV